MSTYDGAYTNSNSGQRPYNRICLCSDRFGSEGCYYHDPKFAEQRKIDDERSRKAVRATYPNSFIKEETK